MESTISEAPIRYDTDNIDVGDISRYFRYIDPSLLNIFSTRGISRNNIFTIGSKLYGVELCED